MIPKSEYAAYFESYISTVIGNSKSITENLVASQEVFTSVLKNIPEEKQLFVYEKNKWTIKEIIQHLIDTERIFCYRALCFSRNQKDSLLGFDENKFVEYCNAKQRNFSDLLSEIDAVRKSTIQLFQSFTDTDLKRVGVASDRDMSVRAAGYIIAGHQNHHLKVIQERYL